MGEPVTTGVLVELDQRRRVSLGRIGRHDQYLAREEADGTLILTPAVVMKVSDLEALVGPRRAGEVGKQPEKVTVRAVDDTGLSKTGRAIIAEIRTAGPHGLPAKLIVQRVDASRSTIFNELANLRKLGHVTNPGGNYLLGPVTP